MLNTTGYTKIIFINKERKNIYIKESVADLDKKMRRNKSFRVMATDVMGNPVKLDLNLIHQFVPPEQ